MTPEQWARVKDVFHAALQRDAAARRDYVTQASGGDEVVRGEVERLLDAEIESAQFIERPGGDDPLTGRTISHYQVGSLLGIGGMGRVYAARDLDLGRDVALKVASFDGADAQSRLRREAQHASRLSHPHVCHIYEVGRADGQLFVVMELVPGPSLAEVLRQGPLSLDHARRIGMDIADALAHAHEHGVIHRDLKSTNVIVTSKRGAKVLDFGLARMLDTTQIDALSQSQRSLTGEGTIAGTLPYMAPELLRGDRGDQRADIWALGVLLYEMMTGVRPFTGGTGFELSAAILHEPPKPLPSNVPSAVRSIVQRCLEKDPGIRYQHASDVYAALQDMTEAAALPGRPRRSLTRRTFKAASLLVVAVLLAALGVRSLIRSAAVSNVHGYSLLEEGQFDQAVEQFQGVASRSPNNANAWDSLGEAYLANGIPEKSLEAYSRALAIDASFGASILGRSLALAALGRYTEALDRTLPDFKTQAFIMSRAGRYREAEEMLEKGRRDEGKDVDINASALLTSAWLWTEQKQYARAREDVRAAETVLAGRQQHSFLVLAGLIGGIAELRAGEVANARARLADQKSHADATERVQSNWIAALEAEIALAEGAYDRAVTSLETARRPAWQPLGRDTTTVFAINLPSRDLIARIQAARGDRPAAIAEYRRITTPGPGGASSAALEPRYVLELARLLDKDGDRVGARAEYNRFLQLWDHADAGLPELTEAKTRSAL